LIDQDSVLFRELKWDSDFFGIPCAKAVLHKPMAPRLWEELRECFERFQLIVIENRNSEPTNAQIIGRETSSFLADVNVQFSRRTESHYELPRSITIHEALARDENILELAMFSISRFTEDPELLKRGGAKVYQEWVISSFGKQEKIFALSRNASGEINGFLLYSCSEDRCVVELISVSSKQTGMGIGKNLFRVVENDAFQRGYKEIRVGTQIRNMNAVNFYHSIGCKQVGCHQIYHLWCT